jgi:hypothetical protein
MRLLLYTLNSYTFRPTMWPVKFKMKLYCTSALSISPHVHKRHYSVKVCGNDISVDGSDWHLSATSKISTLEIWSDTDDVPLFLISQFLSYIHMRRNLQHSCLQRAD